MLLLSCGVSDFREFVAVCDAYDLRGVVAVQMVSLTCEILLLMQ